MSQSQRPPCPYCGNLDFEEEDGILVCTSCGRQQEGGLQVADDEPEFGTLGKVTRKKIERTKVKVSKVYRGRRAYRLYLLAWQHILWRQCYALVHGKPQAPKNLWEIVRDLWGLKLGSLSSKLLEKDTKQQDDSTEQEISVDDSESEPQQERKRTSFQPKLWDTVSLVYLGCLLIRYPLSLSKLYGLIRTEQIPFVRAIRHVPTDISVKLPPEYQDALDTTAIPRASKLQSSVYKFLSNYVDAYGLTLPSLNWRILLLEWIQQLCLPIEIYTAVPKLAEIVGYNFTFLLPKSLSTRRDESRKPRHSAVANPETQLISLIVIAAKYLFPFSLSSTDSSTSVAHPASPPSSSGDTVSTLLLDWSTWLAIQKSHAVPDQNKPDPPEPGDHIALTATDIQSLPPAALDSYMDWYQRTFAAAEIVIKQKKTDLERSILDMFPLQQFSVDNPDPSPANSDNEDKRKKRIIETQRRAMFSAHTTLQCTGSENAQERREEISRYLVFSDMEALNTTNACFSDDGDSSKNPILYLHERAAETACFDVKRLLKAVRHSERKLEKWAEQRKREGKFAEGGERWHY